ncbi:MAG: class I SAM-dependent methyltransferase [Bryobacteraceae bacterium]
MTKPAMAAYALGHSEGELQRLAMQNRMFGELTLDVFRRAGIGEGMKVADFGCGAGDTTFLLRAMVGPGGHVIGIDRSADAIAKARQRAAAVELDNVEFVEANADDWSPAEPLDAVAGRFVMMYQSDPAAWLRRVAGLVRHGGIVAFQEIVVGQLRVVGDAPLFARGADVMLETFRRSGADPNMGDRLAPVFRAAGLGDPGMIAAQRVECGPDSAGYALFAGTLASLMPVAEKLGVTTAAEIEVDTLAGRLREEVVRTGATMFLPLLVGAWATTAE